MGQILDMTARILRFRDARRWKQFHKPKDMALSLVLEAAELAEHFQWKDDKEITAHLERSRKEIGDELADVLYWVLLMAHDLEIDLQQAFRRKMRINEKKYPRQKAKNNHKKYSSLA